MLKHLQASKKEGQLSECPKQLVFGISGHNVALIKWAKLESDTGNIIWEWFFGMKYEFMLRGICLGKEISSHEII